MITTAVAAFVGCFVALLLMAEVGATLNKWLRLLIVFVGGIVLTILGAMLVEAVAGLFGKVG